MPQSGVRNLSGTSKSQDILLVEHAIYRPVEDKLNFIDNRAKIATFYRVQNSENPPTIDMVFLTLTNYGETEENQKKIPTTNFSTMLLCANAYEKSETWVCNYSVEILFDLLISKYHLSCVPNGTYNFEKCHFCGKTKRGRWRSAPDLYDTYIWWRTLPKNVEMFTRPHINPNHIW